MAVFILHIRHCPEHSYPYDIKRDFILTSIVVLFGKQCLISFVNIRHFPVQSGIQTQGITENNSVLRGCLICRSNDIKMIVTDWENQIINAVFTWAHTFTCFTSSHYIFWRHYVLVRIVHLFLLFICVWNICNSSFANNTKVPSYTQILDIILFTY